MKYSKIDKKDKNGKLMENSYVMFEIIEATVVRGFLKLVFSKGT